VVINMATSAADAEAAFAKLDGVARRFLPVRLDYAGWVPLDDAVPRAVRAQRPLVLDAPGSPAARALGALADRLGAAAPAAPSGGLQSQLTVRRVGQQLDARRGRGLFLIAQ
jgi:flagellar biosynthesis protein FlhG